MKELVRWLPEIAVGLVVVTAASLPAILLGARGLRGGAALLLIPLWMLLGATCSAIALGIAALLWALDGASTLAGLILFAALPIGFVAGALVTLVAVLLFRRSTPPV